MTEATIRPAEAADHDAIREMTADTWPQRDGDDYLGRVFPDWIEADDRPKHTLVADDDGTAVAIAQCVLLTDEEAWGQGLRVHPDYRGRGLSTRLTGELFAWARGRGATVARGLVHGWNEAGLGQARAAGYRPAGAFRWMHPTPSPSAAVSSAVDALDRPWVSSPTGSTTDDPAAAWRAYRGSEADAVMGGLGLSMDETWAAAELTRDVLERAADEETVIAVADDVGADAMTYRSRVFDRDTDDGEATIAEYGLARWDRVETAATLLDAVAADAHAVGADRVRMAVPETPRYVSDGALCRVEIDDSPDYVLAADLTGGFDPVRVLR